MAHGRKHSYARSIGLVLLLSMPPVYIAAQQTAPAQKPLPGGGTAQQASSRIAGRIVNAMDGHALSRATVRIAEVQNGRLIASTLSSDTGEFAFEGLGPKKYSLSGETHGYISAAYDEHEQFSTAIVTGAGLDTTSLLLRLMPAATLSGRVLDENGEPVRTAQVTLYREGHASGQSHLGPVNVVQTNDLGDYAFGSLPEGNYYIAVNAVPWYAMHPQPVSPGSESAIVTGVDPALDVAYPITFYPDVTEQEAATAIQVKGGDQLPINLHMKPVHAVRLTIHTAPGEQIAYPQLQMPVFGGSEQMTAQMQTSSPSSTEIVGLPPGRYQMMQTDPKTGSPRGTRTVDLSNGSADLSGDDGEDTASINVSVEEESGVKLPPQMQVVVRGTTTRNVQGQVANEKGEAAFRGLKQDDYHFQVYGANRAYQIVQVRTAGKAPSSEGQPNGSLHLAGGETAVTLVVASTTIAVEGIVKHDGKPAAGAMVLLVPVDAIKNADLFRRDQSDLDGTFSLLNVSAGRYIVIAINGGWTLDWSRQEILARYLTKGVALEIPSTQRRAVLLPEALEVQLR